MHIKWTLRACISHRMSYFWPPYHKPLYKWWSYSTLFYCRPLNVTITNQYHISIGNKCIFVHLKYLIPTFYNFFKTIQYPFRILYLPTQIRMAIVHQKPVLQYFWCTYIDNHLICLEKTINTYLRLRIFSTHKFLALNTYSSSVLKQIQCYNIHCKNIYGINSIYLSRSPYRLE